MTYTLTSWAEMELWPAIWEQDFGFAPIGMHRVEHDMLWYFNGDCLRISAWTTPKKEKLHNAQIGAAVARILKLEDFTLQLRGKNVWLHRPLDKDSVGAISKMFDTEELLIRNLARMSEWLLGNDFVHPRILTGDGTTNLHMLLGKFDFSGTHAIL